MSVVRFRVSAATVEEEVVGVVGDRDEIGKWLLEDVKVMEFDGGSGKWKTEIEFEEAGTVQYRYVILNPVNEGETKKFVVRRWEAGTKILVRAVDLIAGKTSETDDGDFGVINGKNIADQGWLCGQSEVRFNISDAGPKPVISWRGKTTPSQDFRISFEPDEDDLKVKARMISAYRFKELDPTRSVPLPKRDEEVLTFITEVMNLETFSGRFIISDGNENVLGHANVVGDQLHDSVAKITLVILDNEGKSIGSLRLEYMVIKTFEGEPMTLKESYCTYWKKRPTLHIGHRGSGNSFTAETISDLFENTISSFKKAALHGAAMIEFDVQLTKDKIPIVFHDFTICTSVASKTGGRQPSLHEIEVKMLTFEELQNYMTHHRSRKFDSKDLKFKEDDTHPHFRPFPTLREVFKEVPEEVGFDVELKWPHFHENGTWYHGVRDFGDANEYVDKILEVVFECAGTRRIALSCFEANICTLLRRKQNRFPVFYLTCGDAYKGDKFMELRSRCNSLSIPFSASEKFLGLCTEDSAAYEDETLLKKVHEAGLVGFLYGDGIANPENRDLLIKQGADGIIYDRIHDARPEGLNIYQMEASNSLIP